MPTESAGTSVSLPQVIRHSHRQSGNCEVKYLSDILQSPQLDLGTAVTLVDSLVDPLESYREGSLFNDIWDNTVTIAEQCNISVAPPGRQVKRRFSKENGVIMQGIQALNPSSPTFCEKDLVFQFASQYNCSI
ncbi:hypothetical protein F7725_019295 [Dissostichus mawsoni]|uniref:Uncharacterized protein n=1 Tax=Dissostichus mawsoni TaxID=36200 RepID=A0A7J5YJA2_DISMA|nr:hypothetical protein F7725_019295 [Dissostichus mawsoni]